MKNFSTESMQPLLEDVPNFQRFMGRYFVTALKVSSDSKGKSCKVLTLSDASGDLRVFCNAEHLMDLTIAVNQLIHIEAALQQDHGAAYYRCKDLSLSNSDKRVGHDLSVLPRSLCPVEDAFDCLLVMFSRIKNPLLKQFVRDVLLQPDVGINYLLCPASLNYHHNYKGGLIKHSLETAWNIAGVHELSILERDVAVVAALLHDIGKVKTMSPDIKRTQTGRLVDHSQLTLEICAWPLKNLADFAPAIADQLRHAWTCYSPKSRYGFKPKTRVAHLLQRVDNASASGKVREGFLPVFGNSAKALSA
jgi:3'-5' exoribonuclease